MAGVLFFTIILGFAAVFQGGVNKQMGESWGLPGVLLLNATIFFLAAISFYFYSKIPGAPLVEGFEAKGGFVNFKWWYILPGLAGYLFVLGVPYSIVKIGALNVFVVLVAAQIIGGFMWDKWIDHYPISSWQMVSAGFAISSVIVLMLKPAT